MTFTIAPFFLGPLTPMAIVAIPVVAVALGLFLLSRVVR